MNKYSRSAALSILLLTYSVFSSAQTSKQNLTFYSSVQTYTNPVLPGDHPDPTLLKVGDDFYHCGSSFHFNPYLPIYHSKDLVHWKVISRVLTAPAAKWVSDRPSAGIWQGAITYFYGSYWIYFSAGGQWFSKASSPVGPWSAPVQVKTNNETGPLGYDNSIFVDDDGKPYMVIKNGQKVNRLQALGKDGQLTDKVINLDWINAKLQYSWAEGPVMCKRNGFYYYFPAGDVSGGQYVLRATALTSDSSKWERLGAFFKPITDSKVGFRRPNHIAAPVQLKDGSWWTIGQSYEKYDNDDWSGLGRQTALYPVIWEGDRPWGMAPTTQPVIKPNLPQDGIRWRSVETDYFENATLGMPWHFLTKKSAGSYSLSARQGWVRLNADTGRVHLMQKETDHWYTAVTRVEMNAANTKDEAGIYLANGNQKVAIKLCTGFDKGKKIFFKMDTAVRTVPNNIGSTVWLKLQRNEHILTAYFSGNGQNWTSLGAPISAVNLDKAQPDFNSWVGTSVGLFAEGKPADFDFFICKDGYSDLPAVGFSNYYGVRRTAQGVATATKNGGWLMISGVEVGAISPQKIAVTTAGIGMLEIWADQLGHEQPLSQIKVNGNTKDTTEHLSKAIKKLTGQHDIFVRFLPGPAGALTVKSIRFIR